VPVISQPAAETTSALVVEEITPFPDAWEVCQRLQSLPHLLFLDSAAGHRSLGRYSFVTADPVEWIWSRGQNVYTSASSEPLCESEPFTVLAEWLARFRTEPAPDLPPFQGGAAGLFGYDLCHHLERLPRPRFDEFAVPDMAVGIFDWVLSIDHVS